jgi:hypothetical protein
MVRVSQCLCLLLQVLCAHMHSVEQFAAVLAHMGKLSCKSHVGTVTKLAVRQLLQMLTRVRSAGQFCVILSS